jgi:hypothetical protein
VLLAPPDPSIHMPLLICHFMETSIAADQFAVQRLHFV